MIAVGRVGTLERLGPKLEISVCLLVTPLAATSLAAWAGEQKDGVSKERTIRWAYLYKEGRIGEARAEAVRKARSYAKASAKLRGSSKPRDVERDLAYARSAAVTVAGSLYCEHIYVASGGIPPELLSVAKLARENLDAATAHVKTSGVMIPGITDTMEYAGSVRQQLLVGELEALLTAGRMEEAIDLAEADGEFLLSRKAVLDGNGLPMELIRGMRANCAGRRAELRAARRRKVLLRVAFPCGVAIVAVIAWLFMRRKRAA